MTEDTPTQTPRALVELWSATAAQRLRAEQSEPGRISGTDLNRLGELVISAASWLTEDDKAAKVRAREVRIEALRRTPGHAALSMMERIVAEAKA